MRCQVMAPILSPTVLHEHKANGKVVRESVCKMVAGAVAKLQMGSASCHKENILM